MRGRVYLWTADPREALGGRIATAIVALPNLECPDGGRPGLSGRYVRVRNGGAINEPDEASNGIRIVPIGDACPNAEGDFVFDPGRGGGRIDRVLLAKPHYRIRYVEASHFGEVNTYFHLDRIAAYVDEMLHELGASRLPRVTAVVNAHHAATEVDGVRDGVRRSGRWLPFQGGHYRLSRRRCDVTEHDPVSPDGEIHLGPGWQLLEHGTLVEETARRYRANASHNAGILYHEYGHHLTRHTVDFLGNALRQPDRQSNRKTAIDEGISDYWAAALLETPHLWAWHKRHDAGVVHPRSLVSSKTMADCDERPGADVHLNGTVWAAALWDLRTRLCASGAGDARTCDRLVLQSLLLMGARVRQMGRAGARTMRQTRVSFALGLRSLLKADEMLSSGRHHDTILSCFAIRGIHPALAPTPADREVA